MGVKVSILASNLGQNLKNESSYDYNLILSSTDTLSSELARLTERLDMMRSRIDVLDFYAHGMFVPKPDVIYAVLDSQLVGAYGVAIGQDYLTSRSVDMMTILKGFFAPGGVINFHVCALADKNADWTGARGVYSGDGVKLCKAIAKKADCLVRASTSLQKYTRSSDFLSFAAEMLMGGYESADYDLEFLAWSPPTYLFDPKGTAVKES